ncbi:MAG: histidine kinase, partial [Desulfobacterales bacterium]
VVAEKESARAYLLRKLIDAQEDERRRIARELHDGVGQVLTSFIVATNMCAQMDDLVAVQGRNVEMGKVAMETLGQVRMLSRQLRPSIMDDLGLEAALERYADDFPPAVFKTIL